MFKTESFTAAIQENKRQDSIDEEIKAEIKGFFTTETEEANVLNWLNLNKTKYQNLAIFARKYLSAPLSSVYSEILFSEAGNLYKQKRNRLLFNTGERLLFFHHS